MIDRQIINPSDGSKFKAVKNRDKIFTRNKIDWRHTVVELLQKRATNAGSDPILLGEVVLLRATRCARPDPLWRARKELNPL